MTTPVDLVWDMDLIRAEVRNRVAVTPTLSEARDGRMKQKLASGRKYEDARTGVAWNIGQA